MKYGMIYTDFDGVVANFEKGVEKILGRSISDKDWKDMDQGPRNKIYSDACDTVEFWANLEPMPDFNTYWGYIKYWKPGAITAYPMWAKDAREIAVRGKGLWNRKHTMIPADRFHICARSEKKNWAVTNSVPNILIDDHEKNIAEWTNAGGEGIYHTSAISTIIKLKRLGFVK